MSKIIKKIFYIFFPLLIGGIVGVVIKDSIDYKDLIQPPLSPPAILFPIVWSILYLLMGIAYYLFKTQYNGDKKKESKLYYIQLFLNALWSVVFFVLKFRFVAIIWILLLLVLIVDIAYYFKSKLKISYYLFIPYILLVVFATYLTIGIYILN